MARNILLTFVAASVVLVAKVEPSGREVENVVFQAESILLIVR